MLTSNPTCHIIFRRLFNRLFLLWNVSWLLRLSLLLFVFLSIQCLGLYKFRRSGHLLAMASTVYLLLHIFSPKRAFWTSFLFCITYSSWAHLYRMKFDYGGYSADVSLWVLCLHCCIQSILFCLLFQAHHLNFPSLPLKLLGFCSSPLK